MSGDDIHDRPEDDMTRISFDINSEQLATLERVGATNVPPLSVEDVVNHYFAALLHESRELLAKLQLPN